MKFVSVWSWGVLLAGTAFAGPKVLSVGVGDCSQPELLRNATLFSSALKAKAGEAFVDGGALAPVLRPKSKQTVEELQRQLQLAKDQYYSALSLPEFAAVEKRVQSALEEIGRLPPGNEREKLMMEARLRLVLALGRQEKRDKERLADEILRQILRVLPKYELDPQWYTPELREHFAELRKEAQKLPTYLLKVDSIPSGEVFVDGIHMGKTPLEKPLPAGKYDVSVAQKEQVSFAHTVALTEDTLVRVDLGFEGAISNPGTLCLTLPPKDEERLIQATKLGAALKADVVVITSLEKKSAGLVWLTATSVGVDKSQKTRTGSITFAPEENSQKKIDALAHFIMTGEESPDISKQFSESPSPALAMDSKEPSGKIFCKAFSVYPHK